MNKILIFSAYNPHFGDVQKIWLYRYYCLHAASLLTWNTLTTNLMTSNVFDFKGIHASNTFSCKFCTFLRFFHYLNYEWVELKMAIFWLAGWYIFYRVHKNSFSLSFCHFTGKKTINNVWWKTLSWYVTTTTNSIFVYFDINNFWLLSTIFWPYCNVATMLLHLIIFNLFVLNK